MAEPEAQVHDNFSISTNTTLVRHVLQFGLVGKLIADEEVKSYATKVVINKSRKLLNEVKVRTISRNTFLFLFSTSLDKHKVLAQKPWTILGYRGGNRAGWAGF
ncbi:hypothetical protein Ancab_016641 [Ancistrocladus abbreviatus]